VVYGGGEKIPTVCTIMKDKTRKDSKECPTMIITLALTYN